MTGSRRITIATGRARPGRSRRRDGGSVSVELVVLMPLLLMIVAAGVQGAVYYYARSLALAAAQEGARAAAVPGATLATGRTTAASFLTDHGGNALSDVTITGTRTPTTATITVHGTSLSLIPGWTPTLTQTADLPVERLTR